MFVMLFSAQVIAALGFGSCFPYSVPGLYAGIADPPTRTARDTGHRAGAGHRNGRGALTIAWWRRADHTR
ncbi:hypothetical protein [Nonomuraea sp. KM90]|uniref:hypothetical protein n=1 Tax=Nonomuraea sp. KM90 TaxID=3457428 RepID=UPI003FCE11D5